MINPAPALVIGGTRMLAGATRWLAARSDGTLLVARRASTFDLPNATKLDADWSTAEFPARVTNAIAAFPPMGQALVWLHEPESILPWLLPILPGARTVLVLGSLDGKPTLPKGCETVTTLRLGSKRQGAVRRWLTHAEISDAAILALSDGVSRWTGEPAAAQ